MPRVLVVEDSPTQAQQFVIILEDEGFEVQTAPDAELGFALLNRGGFDVVLTDLYLTGDSGFDLCRRIKADPDLRRVPVVVCTSQADPVNVLRGLQAGADGFITKNREPAEIVGCLRRVLARPVEAVGSERTKVVFLGQEFELSAGREQLLDILVSAFEDVVHLNERYQAGAAALRDVNSRLQAANRELEVGRDTLDEFFQVATSLREYHNFEKTFDLVLRFCQRRGYDLAMLSLVDKEAGVVRAVRGVGVMAEIVAKTVRPLDGDDILAIVAREGRTIVIEDSKLDPRCDRETAAAANIRGQVILPLISGEVLGVLQVASHAPLVSTTEGVRTLETLGSQAARALSGLMQMEEIRRLNRQLEERNGLLQTLADNLAETAHSERKAHEELKKAESQLVQAEKLSSLGQMVAGVAHEINNPLAFVTNNVAVLRRDVALLGDLLRLYRDGDGTLAQHQPDLFAQVHGLAEEIDLDYTLESLENLAERSREGLKRIQTIVKNLRDFARLDESDLHEVDLNAGVNSTINVIQTHADERQVALVQDLAPLPSVCCYPAKINQVVLNLLANAVDACSPGGTVTVRTRANAEGVEIEVADTGRGIDPSIRAKIFDPFFTTKPIGQGTGLGLSISYGIVQAHGGRIDVESTPGHGTRFIVHLPFESSRCDSTQVAEGPTTRGTRP